MNIKAMNLDYGTDDSKIFKRTNLRFSPGEISLICGPTGSGKSTLLKILNRLIPTFSSGNVSGIIEIDGLNTNNLLPQEIARLVGYVNQQPESFFVSETVLEEVVFGMEQLGFSRKEMEARAQQIAKLMQIEQLLEKNLETLSAGQKQKVAIAAALAAGQRILLLDEPTSALDHASAVNFLTLLRQLTRELGLIVLIAEHRFERVMPLADSLVVLKGDGSAIKMEPTLQSLRNVFPSWFADAQDQTVPSSSEIVLDAKEVTVMYPGSPSAAIQNVSLQIAEREIVAIQGPNGSGKSTLLMALAGFLKPSSGAVWANKEIRVVPQNASDLLYLPTVAKELTESDRLAKAPVNTTSGFFESLIGRINTAIHPRDLSAGQQLALVISIQLAQGSQLILLDEPTTGFDADSRTALIKQLNAISRRGASILIATHDDNFARKLAHRTLLLQNGKLRSSNEAQIDNT